jgi:hypothetical protein
LCRLLGGFGRQSRCFRRLSRCLGCLISDFHAPQGGAHGQGQQDARDDFGVDAAIAALDLGTLGLSHVGECCGLPVWLVKHEPVTGPDQNDTQD